MADVRRNFVAVCGMVCAICIGHIREKNKCPGCRDMPRVQYCRKCIIRNCKELKGGKKKFCFECEKYPCIRLCRLDKRYRTKYGMSMLENLEYIKVKGINKFVKKETKRWRCKKCGNLLSCHRDSCIICGFKKPKVKIK